MTEGPEEHLYVLHKIKEGVHVYWIVNDTDAPRTNILELRATGRPECWDASAGRRSPLFYQSDGTRTLVRITLGRWDAAYVVFDASGPSQPLVLNATNLDELHVVHSAPAAVAMRGRSLLKGKPLFALLSDENRQFRGEYKAPNIEPLEITGDCNVTVEAPEISLPYAWATNDPGDRGLKERWYAETKGRLNWVVLWLSPMNQAIREWNVIGPFPNPQDRALEEHYAPEREANYDAVYKGLGERELGWLQVNAAAYHTLPQVRGIGLGTMSIRCGLYGDQSFVVNYGEPLRLAPLEGVVYAQTNIYCLLAVDAVMILATPSPRAAFLNGNQVYSRWLRPLYNRLIDGFAARVPVRLDQGWNNLLLKFLHNAEDPQFPHFTCRMEKPDRGLIEGLFGASRVFEDPLQGARRGYRWLKFFVPAVAGALRVPALNNSCMAFVDGRPAPSSYEVALPRGARQVTLRVAADEELAAPFAFSTVPAALRLGTWKTLGLEHFSGSMTFGKAVTVPQTLLAERVLLDCGEVGVVAEAWVNGNPAGSRAWAPYIFEVTHHLRAGTNHVKVRIANTAGNARAVGQDCSNLNRIDRDGWHGPARLAPYIDRDIRCGRV